MKQEYKSNSAYQLAGEDEFIAWVLYGEQATAWEQWLTENKEMSGLAAEAKQIVLDFNQSEQYVLEPAEQQQLWTRISDSVSSQPHVSKKIKPSFIRWATLAAAVVALLIWITTRSHSTTVLATAGEQKEIQLPESSLVQLNAGSSIEFDKKHFTDKRALNLTGEAFFKVHPGSRFTVNTPEGSVTVLGTSFNVLARDGRFEVTCFTGKVMVENTKQQQITITPGQKCIQQDKQGTLKENTFDLTVETPDWTRGKFVFEDQPLRIVAAELERQYNVKVNLTPGLEEIRYTGLFEAGDLDKALYFITWPLHLTATKKGNTVSIVR